jgi:rubredoxin
MNSCSEEKYQTIFYPFQEYTLDIYSLHCSSCTKRAPFIATGLKTLFDRAFDNGWYLEVDEGAENDLGDEPLGTYPLSRISKHFNAYCPNCRLQKQHFDSVKMSDANRKSQQYNASEKRVDTQKEENRGWISMFVHFFLTIIGVENG